MYDFLHRKLYFFQVPRLLKSTPNTPKRRPSHRPKTKSSAPDPLRDAPTAPWRPNTVTKANSAYESTAFATQSSRTGTKKHKNLNSSLCERDPPRGRNCCEQPCRICPSRRRTQTLPSYTYKRFAGVLGECNSSAKGSNLSKSPYAIFRGRQHPLLSLDLTPVVTRLSFRRPGVP